jgi:hypothetical protein
LLVPLEIPPGISRKGTIYQTKGRWYDSDLVRFSNGNVGPVGGWTARTTSAMTGSARAMQVWRGNSVGYPRYIAAGTHTNLYAFTPSATAPVDITPAGFTAGRADATAGGGYGLGPYGVGLYGTPRIDNVSVQDASMWTLDVFGQYLVGCMSDDGNLYEWQLDISTPTVAAVISGAPTGCSACVVTENGFLVALGASSNPRKVQWSDQGVNTTWSPSATNQAGSYTIQSQSRLMCGRRVRGGTLLFTEADVHLMTYIGLPFIHRIDRVGEGCGIVSRGAVAVNDSRAMWMGQAGFYAWDGSGVTSVACEIYDDIFGDMNQTQRSKFWAMTNAQENEVEFHYCTAASTNIDQCAVFNYDEGHWTLRPSVARTCGVDRAGVFVNPIKATSDGYLYDFETGYSWGGNTPYLESGPIEIGDGERIMRVRKAIFDEKTQGDVTVYFKTRDWPGDSETTSAAYTASAGNPIALHFAARAVRLRVEFSTAAASRWGPPRLMLLEGSKRLAA